jgi:dienelactone hydrolase
MTITSRLIDYHHEGRRHEGFFAFDASASAPLPAVLVAHTWAGRDDFACGKAIKLAEMGYAAFALDMYGDAQIGETPEACAQLMSGLMNDRSDLAVRISTALASLRAQMEVDAARVAAIGFCFGGLCVLDLARSGADLQGVVSFHGLFAAPDPLPINPILAKVLILHGFEDPMAQPEQAIDLGRELTRAGADWQLHLYGNTLHAFTNPKANNVAAGTVYNATADARSWESLRDFLAEVLK